MFRQGDFDSPPFILQTVVNNVPLDGSFFETQYGVVIVLSQVLKVSRNRCSKQISLQVNVSMEGVMNRWKVYE